MVLLQLGLRHCLQSVTLTPKMLQIQDKVMQAKVNKRIMGERGQFMYREMRRGVLLMH